MTRRIGLLGDSQAQGLATPLRSALVGAGWTAPRSDAWVADPGASTLQLIPQLPGIVRAGAIDVLVVTAGGNDHRTSEGQRTLWRELVSRAKTSGIGHIVWVAPPRAMDAGSELDEERRRVADAIVETFAGDPQVTVVRGRELTQDIPLANSVHFGRDGYRRFAERLAPLLAPFKDATIDVIVGNKPPTSTSDASGGGGGLLLLAAAVGAGAFFLARSGRKGGVAGLGRVKLPSDATRELVSASQARKRIEKRAGGPVPLDVLPAHIRPYAEFMERASTRKPTAREIVKAYVITRSSVQRQALKVPTVCRASYEVSRLVREMEIEGKGKIRPEDVMSRLLLSKEGKHFLDLASKGEWGSEPARAALELSLQTRCFGFAYDLLIDMREAAKLAKKSDEIGTALRTLPPEAWVKYVQKNIPGVSGAKAGFIAALLGRGDVPTFDARELKLWRKDQKSKGIDVKPVDVMALRKRIASWKMDLAPQHEPFRQHLVHHALWDAYPESGKGTETTHSEVVRAMELAGVRRRR